MTAEGGRSRLSLTILNAFAYSQQNFLPKYFRSPLPSPFARTPGLPFSADDAEDGLHQGFAVTARHQGVSLW
jgi:hypothetical protein